MFKLIGSRWELFGPDSGKRIFTAFLKFRSAFLLFRNALMMSIPYRLYITAQKFRFLPYGVTARTENIYLFWGCGTEKREFLAYFGACQAKIVGVN
jgi:hypothetical protein